MQAITQLETNVKCNFLHLTGWTVYRWKGDLYTFDLWRKDLELHFLYITRIRMLSPVIESQPPANASKIAPEIAARIDLVKVPNITSKKQFIVGFLPFFFTLIRELKKAEVAQFILVEQPIFYGFLISFLRRFTQIPTIVFVESSAWRKKHLWGKFSGILKIRERMARLAVENATISFHTQSEYQRSLHGNAVSSLVVPAVWMNEEDVLSEEQLRLVLTQRSQTRSLSLGYFGGIIYDKGLDVLIKAIILCIETGMDVKLDVFGEGAMKATCLKLAEKAGNRIQFCGMLPYGPLFRERLGKCDAIIIPSRTNEHLRINVDAMSQGVPVIASDVPGLSQFVRHKENGLLVLKESESALVEAIELMQSKQLRESMAFEARRTVQGLSHEKMHLSKANHIRKVLPNLLTIKPKPCVDGDF